MKLGDPQSCYFCTEPATRTAGSSAFDVELSCCDRCGEALDGLFPILENRASGVGDELGADEDRAEQYDATAAEFEAKALAALEDLHGYGAGDPVAVLLIRSIAAAAVSETMARLIRLGKA